MAKTITLPNNWIPRAYQMPSWKYLEGGGKRLVAVWHRRSGKDDFCLHWTATYAAQKPATYWHMLPEASQARKAIWDAVNPHTGKRRIDEAFPLDFRKRTIDNEMKIEFVNGSMWQVVGSDNYDSLVGSPPHGIVFSEWPLGKAQAWAMLRPMLLENDGWALFVYTPRGNNHGKKTYDMAISQPDWHCELLTVDDTGVFTPEQLDNELKEMISELGETRGRALFNQEYYCSFHEAFDGKCVYNEFSRKMHVATDDLTKYAIDGVRQGRTIIRGWDNTGLSPACVVCYVNSLGQLFVLKEFCGSDIGIIDFAYSVTAWCDDKFGDANYRDIADPAGRIRDSIKKSPAQYMREEVGLILEDGVQTFKIRRESVAGLLNRMVQGMPAILINPEGCEYIIEGFEGGYCYPEIGQTGMYKPEPEKNKYSHPHDALQYPCTRLFGARYETYDDAEIMSQTMDKDSGRSKYGGY